MRIIVLAPNIYSERALVTTAALQAAGHAPCACLCVSHANLRSILGKVRQVGPRFLIRYMLRRLHLTKSQVKKTSASNPAQNGWVGRFDNPYLEQRLHATGHTFANLAQACRAFDIPLYKCHELNDADVHSSLHKHRPDLLVYTGGGILRQPLIDIPRIGVLNAHSGVLPDYRGMSVSEWALLNQAPVGITVHLIDSGIDTGRILFTRLISPIAADVSLKMLQNRIVDATAEALVEGALQLVKAETSFMAQQSDDGKQYFAMHQKLREIVERRFMESASKLDSPQDSG